MKTFLVECTAAGRATLRAVAELLFVKCRFLILACSATLSGCVLPVPHYTANTLQALGQVVDARSARPVAGAFVSIRNHPKTQSMTDSRGYFTTVRDTTFQPVLLILPMPQDRVYSDWLVVSAHGYEPNEQKLTAFPGGDPINYIPLVTLKEPIRLRPQ